MKTAEHPKILEWIERAKEKFMDKHPELANDEIVVWWDANGGTIDNYYVIHLWSKEQHDKCLQDDTIENIVVEKSFLNRNELLKMIMKNKKG